MKLRIFSLLILFWAAPVPPRAQPAPAVDQNKNHYILLIHKGAGTGTAATLPKDTLDQAFGDALKALLKAGYSVREPDDKADTVSGPGVDYSDNQDAAMAAEVAKTVNDTLPPSITKLAPRLNPLKNPLHYLDVWLF